MSGIPTCIRSTPKTFVIILSLLHRQRYYSLYTASDLCQFVRELYLPYHHHHQPMICDGFQSVEWRSTHASRNRGCHSLYRVLLCVWVPGFALVYRFVSFLAAIAVPAQAQMIRAASFSLSHPPPICLMWCEVRSSNIKVPTPKEETGAQQAAKLLEQ